MIQQILGKEGAIISIPRRIPQPVIQQIYIISIPRRIPQPVIQQILGKEGAHRRRHRRHQLEENKKTSHKTYMPHGFVKIYYRPLH